MDEAIRRGPQVITRRGVETVIVLSYADYRKMSASRKRLSTFFGESPLAGVELDLSRDKSPARGDYFFAP